MSYQVLARKWRPQTFAEIVGQQHVIRALSNALNHQQCHHAYLFTGTRGTGKTTIARILAKCVNCATGMTATPCGTCQPCQDISRGRFVDLIEVDAASRTKVEDTRELLNNVQYPPTQGRYKVYLIDEVHMLSNHSFNALLKTLEEPPPHVIFLLATTDPQKLPVTVLSRCLQFHLKNLLPEQIQAHLAHILEHEQLPFEPPALSALATAAGGSVRDALSLLDQAIAYSNQNVTTAEVRAMLGTIEQDHLYHLLNALQAQNGQQLLQLIAQIAEQTIDFAHILADFISLLHQVALQQAIPELAATQPELTQFAEHISAEDIQLYYQIGIIGQRDLPLAPSPQSGFEMVMLRMLTFTPKTTPAHNPPEHTPPPTTMPSPPTTTVKPAAPSTTTPAATTTQPVTAPPPQAAITGDVEWSHLISQLPFSGLTKTLVSYCIISEQQETHWHLLLDPSQAAVLNDRQQQRMSDIISAYFGREIKVSIRVSDTEIACPARVTAAQRQQQLAAAQDTIANDPNVQAIMTTFNASIQTDSVEAIETT